MAGARSDAWLKPGVLIGGLSPLAVVGLRALRGTLGPNPIAELLNQLGLLALIFLVASLGATPLKRLWGLDFGLKLRRMLGLFAFFYATLHLLCYVLLDRFGELATLLEDVTKRPFIIVGLAAFLVLVPLAITSTRAMQKRLGGARWRRLHQLSYVAAGLALLHFFMRVKRDMSEPMAYAAVLLLLLGARLYTWAQRRKERAYS